MLLCWADISLGVDRSRNGKALVCVVLYTDDNVSGFHKVFVDQFFSPSYFLLDVRASVLFGNESETLSFLSVTLAFFLNRL
jgi:hypothetical protein